MSEENGQMSEFTEEAVREELRAWLEENWNPDLGLVEWRNMLGEFRMGRAALAERMVRPRVARGMGTSGRR